MPASSPEAIRNNKLRSAILATSYYWFNRLILGCKAADSHSNHPRHLYKVLNRQAVRRLYARRRATGMSSAEAKYRTKEQQKQASRAYRAKWGGDPSHIGSQAWIRREIARTEAQK